MRRLILPFFAILMLATTVLAQQAIDFNKARELNQRRQQGQALTPEEQAYLQRAIAERQRLQTQPASPTAAQSRPGAQPAPPPPPRESTGLTPLTDFAPNQKYKSFDGGLYGNYKNDPPPSQLKLAQSAISQIKPLDSAGKPSPSGKIVFLSIGMSNTTQEFSTFKPLADRDPAKSPLLTIVDGAQGGQDAPAWTRLAPGTHSALDNPVWKNADQRLTAAGVTPSQVQIVWIKQALIQQARFGEFPDHAKTLQKELQTIVTLARTHYPNLQLAYLSSRIYAGYATTPLNPEPYAYEGAFSIRWLIEDQVNGSKDLNADTTQGPVKAPVLLWGPYLWADGTKGRTLDKLTYTREDLGPDGTHPSNSGREKVANLLLTFFKTSPTTSPWFLKSPH